MIPVLMLFLIPVGGGIPAGVLLARSHGLAWPVTAGLYLVSDIILALLCEPVLRLVVAVGRKISALARAAEAVRCYVDRTTAHYGGVGPFAFIMIAFGIDPITGRAAAAVAGHGFLKGWAMAIAGDMLYFAVIMASTLRVNLALSNPTWTIVVILVAMIILPITLRRLKAEYAVYKAKVRRAASGD